MDSIKLFRFVLCLLLLACAFTPLRAQTFAEWFKQTSTQKKYLLQQIAGLQVYIGYAKEGYSIASSGLGTVKSITNGEFGLHSAFINGLKQVSPAIRNNAKVVEIISMQLAISRAFNGIKNSNGLSLNHLMYIQEVQDNIATECSADLEELLLVITSGKVEMSDDERIKRLDKIYASMMDKSAFVQHFCNEVNLLTAQKNNEQNSIHRLRKLYEIN